MTVYYNEIDPSAAAWLRELIKAGHIAAGEVDERSIEDVRADDLLGYTQCHFFAGIGGWSLALRMAGWPDDRPVWTGSAPCQPFSAAGRGLGESDERHLWPAFYRLIAECRPGIIFGEQVASPLVVGRAKKAAGPGIRKGLPDAASGEGFDPTREAAGREKGDPIRPGRACRADSVADRLRGLRSYGNPAQSGRGQDMGQPQLGPGEPICGLPLFKCEGCASRAEQCNGGLGREHRHQDGRRDDETPEGYLERILAAHRGKLEGPDEWAWIDVVRSDLERARYAFGASDIPAAGIGAPHIRQRLYWCGVGPADSSGARLEGRNSGALGDERKAAQRGGGIVRLADATEAGLGLVGRRGGDCARDAGAYADQHHDAHAAGPLHGRWGSVDWLGCRDGKWRPVEPGTFPLAHGLPRGMVRGWDQRMAPNSSAEGRVMRLRGYGNAIVPQVASAFISAAMG